MGSSSASTNNPPYPALPRETEAQFPPRCSASPFQPWYPHCILTFAISTLLGRGWSCVLKCVVWRRCAVQVLVFWPPQHCCTRGILHSITAFLWDGHGEAQCPALWHPERHPTAPGSESGMLPSGTCPFWLPSTCCMRPTPIPLGWICCFFPHGQVSWPLPWQVQDLGCPCCRAWFWELLLQKETGSPPNLRSC